MNSVTDASVTDQFRTWRGWPFCTEEQEEKGKEEEGGRRRTNEEYEGEGVGG